jgi:hypothetical protein
VEIVTLDNQKAVVDLSRDGTVDVNELKNQFYFDELQVKITDERNITGWL